MSAYENEKVVIKYHNGNQPLPGEVLELRKRTFVDEKAIMAEKSIISPWDRYGVHTLIYDRESGALIAAMHALPCEQSEINSLCESDQCLSSDTIFATRFAIHPEHRAKGLLQLLSYSGLRPFMNRKYLTFYMHESGRAIQHFTKALPLYGFKNIKITDIDSPIELSPWLTTIEKAMTNCFNHIPSAYKDIVQRMIIDDIELHLEQLLKNFFQGGFWDRVANLSLSKYEYISILKDMHQYVRMTTRTLCLAAGHSTNRELRNFYIYHLKEEIDHEKILEADLHYLGEDVDFLIHDRPMCKPARMITSFGESIITFRQSPEMYLAVPFLLEGLAGAVSHDHIKLLTQCIKSWGINSPQKAASMLISHAGFDGGHDGHHLADLKMIRTFINTERKKRELLENMNLVYNALVEIFNPAPVFSRPRTEERGYSDARKELGTEVALRW